MRICIVIPVYNHEQALRAVLAGLKPHGLPCLLVDDGSAPACRDALDAMQRNDASWVHLVRHEQNQGKGAAIFNGLRWAQQHGYTHVLQVDADGQHNLADVPRFIEAAEAGPEAMITGTPIYDESAPRGRLYGRYATHVWVWINTLSLDIKDSMCGFRVYPIARTLAVADSARVGLRMEFDTEIIVRLHWRGTRTINLPTHVVYPLGGISHFDMWRDNLRISRMHTRLFFGMLLRLPLLLARRLSRAVQP